MELYRQIYGPSVGCGSHALLQKIISIGQPRANTANLRIKDLQLREQAVFYPSEEVKALLQLEASVREVLKCCCDVCKRHLRLSAADQIEIVKSILNPRRPKIILLAILVYLGRSFMIKRFSRQDSLHDGALAIQHSLLSAESWRSLLDCDVEEGALNEEGLAARQCFLDNYSLAVNMFNPPIFRTQDPWTFEYPEDCRFPFLDDQWHREGSFGEVRKFNIHKNYLEIDDRFSHKDWYRKKRKHIFARKILRIKNTNKLDWGLEKTALRAISAQGHPNIIELLFVYRWRDQYNFVFPFVERNLQEVLHSDWSPHASSASLDGPFEEHWLWKQMVEVASALKTIHNPSTSFADLGSDDPAIGFHFDLKPANILVTNDGLLQITDFGQALIKFIGRDDLTYGVHRGGSLTYQAPEACPTRTSMLSRKLNEQVHRRYDVWSLACIMLQVLTYIVDGGKGGVEAFENQRREEEPGEAFYTTIKETRLKVCVQAKLHQYEHAKLGREADAVYLSKVLDLLSRMFEVDQRLRPPSEIVHDELDQIAKGFFSDHAGQQQIACCVANYPIPHGYVELEQQGATGTKSFLDMNAVQARALHDQSSVMSLCHFRLLLNTTQQTLRMERFSGKDNSAAYHFSLKNLRYVPLYMYDKRLGNMDLSCALVGVEQSIHLRFGLVDDGLILDLYSFQNTILQSSVISDFRQVMATSLRSQVLMANRCNLRAISIEKSNGKRAETIDTGNIRVQLWAPISPRTLLSETISRLGSRVGGSSCLRLIVFIANPKRFINIPLDRDKRLTSIRFRGKQSQSIAIIPNAKFYHESFSLSDMRATDRSLGPELAPLLWNLEKMEKDRIGLRIELHFIDAEEKSTFENIFRDNTDDLWL